MYEGVGSIFPYSYMSTELISISEWRSLKINLEEFGVKKLT